jgi:1-acyl-sn-glycerol-3-phosphate acyltransferase
MKSVLYSNPFVKKKIVNNYKEDFSKPAVIISNHTSFLDILAVGMITPKMIYLVNDWVYNSPIFGRVVKLAGYYPASQGIEGSVEHLRDKIEKGYSLMIFPEGTRSNTNEIGRFYKGAFYLAEHFNIDVLPVYIHGNSETLPKGDHIIYDESITVVIDKRIKADDTSFGENYSQRTKSINKYFRSEFNKLRSELEDENYFENKLFLSFLYKEREIISEVKSDFSANKSNYYKLNSYINPEAKVVHIASDYGQIDFLLSMQDPKRKVKSFTADLEKREIASSNYLVKKYNINYIESFENDCKDNDVLLISNPDFNFEGIQNYLNNFQTVILFNCSILLHKFEQTDFKISSNDGKIIVLKK